MPDYGIFKLDIAPVHLILTTHAFLALMSSPAGWFSSVVALCTGTFVRTTVFTPWALFITWALMVYVGPGPMYAGLPNTVLAQPYIPYVGALIVLVLYTFGAWVSRPRASNLHLLSGRSR